MRNTNSWRVAFKASLFLGSAVTLLAPSAWAQQVADSSTESVIVTGTRFTGMTAEDSAAPITVIGSDTLTHVGQPNLTQSLSQNIPSFNAEAHGGDTANLTLSARLRGLSPNDTLVLVDGKRRHSTANLHVLGGQFQGGASPDLDLIPQDSIDHVEVLQDGAAAQYGTDAIAGVVNIILKKNSSGGLFSSSGGQYFSGDGDTYDFTGNVGFPIGDKGFISVTGEKRYRGFSIRGGEDNRLFNAAGTPLTTVYDATLLPGYPGHTNFVDGDPESQLTTVFVNAGYDITPDISLYGFGSYGRRDARSYENTRLPNTTIARSDSNNPTSPNYQTNPSGTYTTAGELIYSVTGYRPLETLKEDDWSYTAGSKGTTLGWAWDLSGTYGKDINKIGTADSANNSLYIDTHTSPSQFYDGSFIASQLTVDLDANHSFDIGMASPLNVAAGLEGREDTYAITPGDSASYYKTGAQSFPGYAPAAALSHSRKNYAEYVDFALAPIEALQLDLAGRHEYYTDFHDASVGKFTARYDFSPSFAIRGTISSGFRAPTLPEEYYTATNVSPTSATVQIGPNSPAAKVEGLSPLKPESSANYSVGFVAHIFDGLSATVDAYSIAIGNRIVGTGTVYAKLAGVVVNPTIQAAIIANGNNLDPAVPKTGTTAFTNGVDTLTEGLDVTANYASDFDDWGTVNWTAGGNWGQTTISHFAPNPVALGTTSLFTPTAIDNLTKASPKFKISLGALWTWGIWTVNARENIYGPSSVRTSPDGVNYFPQKVETAGITDLEVSNNFFDNLTLTVGANNVFDQNPEKIGIINGIPADNASLFNEPNSISPYGIDGGYYYGRVTIRF